MKAVLFAAAAAMAAAVIPTGFAEAGAAGAATASSGSGHGGGDVGQAFRGSPGGFDCGVRNRGSFSHLRGGHGDGDGNGDGSRRHRRESRGFCDVSVGTWVESGEWALYNNRSWESDSYNDWWHDRPDRAFPRWMQNNQQCDRMWWGGGVWRC